jgi:hypothetical protein
MPYGLVVFDEKTSFFTKNTKDNQHKILIINDFIYAPTPDGFETMYCTIIM